MALNVQFADATAEVIVAYFCAPQNETFFPNQGLVETNDARWSAFYGSLPPIMSMNLPAPTTGTT